MIMMNTTNKKEGREMATIILNGSDKQNAWAQDIVDTWMDKVDDEITRNGLHIKGNTTDGKNTDVLARYNAMLVEYRDKAIAKLATMTSKQVIDMYTHKQLLDAYVIGMARKATEK